MFVGEFGAKVLSNMTGNKDEIDKGKMHAV
jgi:hypothetical protein